MCSLVFKQVTLPNICTMDNKFFIVLLPQTKLSLSVVMTTIEVSLLFVQMFQRTILNILLDCQYMFFQQIEYLYYLFKCF